MLTSLSRRLVAIASMSALAVAAALAVGPGSALAGTTTAACPFADVDTGTECVINQAWTIGGGGVGANNFTPALPGPYAFHRTLHITNTGSLMAIGTAGITLSIDNLSGALADSAGGTGELLMDAGASLIDTNENGSPPNNGAGPLTISATGGAQLAAGSALTAQNFVQSGNGGDITLTLGASSSFAGLISSAVSADTLGTHGGHIVIDVTGNLVLAATAKIDSEKIGDSGIAGAIDITVSGDMILHGSGSSGATITAAHPGATSGTPGGNITITVGSGISGTFTMESGSLVDSSSGGFAGNIAITAGKKIDIQYGAKVLAGQLATETTLGHGGRIFLVSGCDVEVAGTVSSQGQDPGADLVHLEGCLVHVASTGLVESTGAGHEDVANSCDGVNDPATTPGGDSGEVLRPDHPDDSTVCVEIWARHVVIDAGGEVNADFALSGGITGHGWIDIFAQTDITIAGPPSGSTYAVHSNSGLGNDVGGDIRVKAENSFVAFSGKAVQANATADGGSGGHVTAQGGGAVTFDGASLQALGGQDPIAGVVQNGGTIEGRSFSGNLSGGPGGELNTAAFANNGSVTLQGCAGVTTYTGFTAPGALSILGNTCSPTVPTFPTYLSFNTAAWDACSASTISGTKFDDQNADHVRDGSPLEPGLGGWGIHLFGTDLGGNPVHMTATTVAVTGAYTFSNVPPGIYTICEQLPVATPPWQQTYPTAATPNETDCVSPGDPAADNPTPGPLGYSVDLSSACCSGQTITGEDFGNVRLATKSGTKFNDLNGNGTRDGSPLEPGLPNWTIHLYGTAVDGSAVHQTTSTGATGAYSFTVLPGSYTVCEALMTGWTQSYPAAATIGSTACSAAADPAADNPTPGPRGWAITLAEGATDADNDFGNFAPATKSGTKFNDLNDNHVRDGTPQEPGIQGWFIHLYGTDGLGNAVHQTATTDVNGAYSFTVNPGTYTVCEALVAGWTQTYPTASTTNETACTAAADPATDNPTPGPLGYAVTLVSGQAETGNDFGNVQPLASPPEKSGYKFDDLNGDGIWEQGEPGLNNWTITVWDSTQTNIVFQGTTQNDPSNNPGFYDFVLDSGVTYVVCETQQSGWSQTAPVSGPANIVACTHEGTLGYKVTLSGGVSETHNDFGNTQAVCEKGPVRSVLGYSSGVFGNGGVYPTNKGPDKTVYVNHGQSVQAAVTGATDANGDGFIIIQVVAHDPVGNTIALGGSANQAVAVSQVYTKPFALIGCSVTLTGGGANPAVWIKSTASSTPIKISDAVGGLANLFLMDLHGGNSAVGEEADGSGRYLRNEGNSGSTGNTIGMKIYGSGNTVHNGAAVGSKGDGVYVYGSNNILTDTNSMSNGGNGFNVVGSGNQLLKLDAGEKGTPNLLDGVHVVGSSNTLTENDAFANGGDGFDVSGGSGNILSKNVAGDRGKGNSGNGFLIVGGSNNLTENSASANKLDGFNISGGATLATANLIKNNLSNTGAMGSDLENLGREWRFLGNIKNNGGGNKADGVLLASGVKGLTNFPLSGSTFWYSVVQCAE